MDVTERLIYICDEHEWRSGIPDILIKKGHEVRRQTLPVGDYALSKSYVIKGVVDVAVRRIEVVIERKANDTIQSIIKRLWNEQLYRMGMSYWHSFLVVEGNLRTLCVQRNFPYTTVRKNLVRAAIKRAPAGQQGSISVLQSYDKYDTAGIIEDIATSIKDAEDLYRMPEILAPKIGNVPNMRVKGILAAFPDVGPHRAELLLKRFLTLDNIFRASPDELVSVKGIGKKTIDKFIKIKSYRYEN